jgi:acyl carrier protein
MSNFEKLQTIFRKVFDDDGMTITRELCAADVDDWDSLNQMNLVAFAEQEFGVQFGIDELLSWKNVGDFFDCIENLLKEGG